jgi:hypothetical protein
MKRATLTLATIILSLAVAVPWFLILRWQCVGCDGKGAPTELTPIPLEMLSSIREKPGGDVRAELLSLCNKSELSEYDWQFLRETTTGHADEAVRRMALVVLEECEGK